MSAENETGKAVTERAKPTLITIGKRTFISTGRWNNDLMADYVIAEGDDWIKIGELARVGCASNTIDNKRRVRARLSTMFKLLRERGYFLAVKYDGENGAASEVKIADLKSNDDRDKVMFKLNSMKKRKEMSQDQYDKSVALLHKAIC